MHHTLAAYILAIFSTTTQTTDTDIHIIDLRNCTAAAARVDDTTITITAAHCKPNWTTIAPDLAWQTSQHTTSTPLDEAKEGPAIAHTRRGKFTVTLTDERYVGYIVTRDWTPIPGDSGSPITQNGRIVAIVSWRSLDGSHGGHHRITRQQIEAIRKHNRPLPTVPKLRIMPRLRKAV